MKQLDNTLNTHTSREEWEGSSDLGVAQFGEMSQLGGKTRVESGRSKPKK